MSMQQWNFGRNLLSCQMMQLPHAPLSISKAKAKRKSLQKAVTGVKFRQIMIERQKQKEKLEREKQKRRERANKARERQGKGFEAKGERRKE
ncbi:hypothetical protein DPMN_111298 [Dreissena polymorpha]|uniref:Uncharacterized protein n=1 Tax=Dreissena polymorpha TaxID=45954 RepID=A0A9D4KEU7_DREPO|nr:hypothetical protein DPMN_111298 [Dreissena polymorpha]